MEAEGKGGSKKDRVCRFSSHSLANVIPDDRGRSRRVGVATYRCGHAQFRSVGSRHGGARNPLADFLSAVARTHEKT